MSAWDYSTEWTIPPAPEEPTPIEYAATPKETVQNTQNVKVNNASWAQQHWKGLAAAGVIGGTLGGTYLAGNLLPARTTQNFEPGSYPYVNTQQSSGGSDWMSTITSLLPLLLLIPLLSNFSSGGRNSG